MIDPACILEDTLNLNVKYFSRNLAKHDEGMPWPYGRLSAYGSWARKVFRERASSVVSAEIPSARLCVTTQCP